MRLKQSAGWNQTAEDWVRLVEIAPEGCFGIDVEGTLAATTTAVCYGNELAWIGMVLTAPQYRGRGLARSLMQHALAYVDQLGIGCIKLDATEMGRPLYEKLGFKAECVIERWFRPPVAFDRSPSRDSVEPIDFALDREAFGADRERLLSELAKVESWSFAGARAMSRPGSEATYFGPCVARSPGIASELVTAFL